MIPCLFLSLVPREARGRNLQATRSRARATQVAKCETNRPEKNKLLALLVRIGMNYCQSMLTTKRLPYIFHFLCMYTEVWNIHDNDDYNSWENWNIIEITRLYFLNQNSPNAARRNKLGQLPLKGITIINFNKFWIHLETNQKTVLQNNINKYPRTWLIKTRKSLL